MDVVEHWRSWGFACLLALIACDAHDAKPSADNTPARSRADFAREGLPSAGSTASQDCATAGERTEVCNGRDDDCDGDADEASADASCGGPHTAALCRDGECVTTGCRDRYRDCDRLAENGCEVAPDDPNHCGVCGRRCELENANATCEENRCAIASCVKGFGDCDGDGAACETVLGTEENCGECGHTCPALAHARSKCEAGACGPVVCDLGYADCNLLPTDGCEQALDTLQHCGECNASCRFATDVPHAQAACGRSGCVSICSAGYADCDGRFGNGCEVALNTVAHCGACGERCEIEDAEAICVDGSCEVEACHAGFGDCDGDERSCETRLDSVDHCGSCGDACSFSNAIASCAGATGDSSCQMIGCEAGFADCDGHAANGCERELRDANDGGTESCEPEPEPEPESEPELAESHCVKATRAGHDYYVCADELAWPDARRACQIFRLGDLAVIDSAAEADFVRPLLRERHWIGLTDANVDGLWFFARDGVPFWRGSWLHDVIEGALVRWLLGEPDGSGDCAALTTSGSLEDLNCSSRYPFVCEVAPDACPNDSSKVDPGQCGCGTADTDSDRDGFADCLDP